MQDVGHSGCFMRKGRAGVSTRGGYRGGVLVARGASCGVGVGLGLLGVLRAQGWGGTGCRLLGMFRVGWGVGRSGCRRGAGCRLLGVLALELGCFVRSGVSGQGRVFQAQGWGVSSARAGCFMRKGGVFRAGRGVGVRVGVFQAQGQGVSSARAGCFVRGGCRLVGMFRAQGQGGVLALELGCFVWGGVSA